MAGRYWNFSWLPPVSRNGRQVWPTRWRRRVEGRAWRRYAGLAMAEEAHAEDAENDPETDCQHGCNGMCELHGSERCTFLCHPPFEEMFGDKYD